PPLSAADQGWASRTPRGPLNLLDPGRHHEANAVGMAAASVQKGHLTWATQMSDPSTLARLRAQRCESPTWGDGCQVRGRAERVRAFAKVGTRKVAGPTSTQGATCEAAGAPSNWRRVP